MICSGTKDGEPKSDPPEKKSDQGGEDKKDEQAQASRGQSFESTHRSHILVGRFFFSGRIWSSFGDDTAW